MQHQLRDARSADLTTIHRIYAHHVLHGLASFEEQAPDLTEMTRRFAAVSDAGYPWLVATAENGEVVGYAYASNYRGRPAYRFSVENTVYVSPDAIGQGLGKSLLRKLIEECEARGHRQMIAVIGDSENLSSIGLHVALGFTHAGKLDSVGFKHGRWVDSVLMQRPLALGDTTLPSDADKERSSETRRESARRRN